MEPAVCTENSNYLELDERHKDVGLTDREARYILSVCRKYRNHRDTLDDLYQTCLIAIWQGFRRIEERGDRLNTRAGYIRRVCFNILNYKFIQESKNELLYKCVWLGRNDSVHDSLTTSIQDIEAENVYGVSKIIDSDLKIDIERVMAEVLTEEEIWLLLEYENGYSQQELADKIDSTQSKVSVRLSRARAKLVEALAPLLSD